MKRSLFILSFLFLFMIQVQSQSGIMRSDELVKYVKEAGQLVTKKGEGVFKDFRVDGSRWRKGEQYVFVIDPSGNMLVHADQSMEGKNQLELKDINGKPIIRGLLSAAGYNQKKSGWYHYEWFVPGNMMPRWKSSYVEAVKAPSGKSYIVGSGIYNDRMERSFVIDMVHQAGAVIRQEKDEAFRLFHDPAGPFIAKDAYIFVVNPNGLEMVNPAHPNLEGRNMIDVKDKEGKYLVREMLKMAEKKGSGWVDYMWPKTGETIATQKSTYVAKVPFGDSWVLVGCGVYLADAPRKVISKTQKSASSLMGLVNEAAEAFKDRGESAFADFRIKGTKWFSDDTYFFAFTKNGTRALHAMEPQTEGRNDIALKDVLGRPIVKMFLDAGFSKAGEGWVHYMWPEPGEIFPSWKSAYVKRVTFPSGKQYIVGSGIYNMQLDKMFIEDMVNRASALVAEKGVAAFPLLRDKKGPFVFMNTYVFVDNTEGIELVNGGQPAIEGKNLMELKDLNGKQAMKEYMAAALEKGSGWVEYYWYKPWTNEPGRKLTYVKKVQHGNQTYVVGAGYFPADEEGRLARF